MIVAYSDGLPFARAGRKRPQQFEKPKEPVLINGQRKRNSRCFATARRQHRRSRRQGEGLIVSCELSGPRRLLR